MKISINRETVKTRIKMKNLNGFAHQRTSPLSKVEPLIVQWCIELANMGNPLTRDSIIEPANEGIDNTIHSQRLNELKTKTKINSQNNVAICWYRGFHHRN
jgi:hypothetical protein